MHIPVENDSIRAEIEIRNHVGVRRARGDREHERVVALAASVKVSAAKPVVA